MANTTSATMNKRDEIVVGVNFFLRCGSNVVGYEKISGAHRNNLLILSKAMKVEWVVG
jgi:hypothetical protein